MSNFYILEFIKKHKIKLFIFIAGILFFYLNGITYSRFIAFLIVLEFILIYRITVKHIEGTDKLIIQNKNILKFIVLLNKYRNPILICLIKGDVLMYDLIIYYNNKILNTLIYLIYVLLINPVKIFYFKFYIVLNIGKTNKIGNLLFSRMFGLILSILIFTNIINYMTNTLHLNLFMIIYIYLLIISISCEMIATRDNQFLKIILVNYINTGSVIANKLYINLLSIILKKNDVDELSYYFNDDIINKVNKFKVGYMWYLINSLIYFKNKPNYLFYFKLRSALTTYLMIKIDTYIFFKYYNGDIDFSVIKELPNINKLKAIYEYDYKVFKVLLGLYWDMEYYLENLTFVKDSLKIDIEDLVFLKIKLNNEFLSDIEFLDKVKYKDINIFISDKNSLYDYIQKIDLCNSELLIEKDLCFKLYTLYNMGHADVCTLKLMNTEIDPIYYQEYIDSGYKEGCSEFNIDLSLKYKKKISELEFEYNSLLKLLQDK